MNTFAGMKELLFQFDETSRILTVRNGGKIWRQDKSFRPWMKVGGGDGQVTLFLDDALEIQCGPFATGIAAGYRIRYTGWVKDEETFPISIETLIWVHTSTARLYFELLPVSEAAEIEQIAWPSPWEWKADQSVYSVFPLFQGAVIPGDWPAKINNGGYCSFCSVGAPMPWFGQIDEGSGCLQIIDTPWDCDYHFYHPTGGPTEFQPIWKSSLGSLRYKRTLRMEFFNDCDYNDFCKSYRQYVKEQGRLVTLKQKEAANHKIARLAGAPIIHSSIYYYIKPEALIYDAANPEANHSFASFAQRQEQLRALIGRGLKKAYFHLDGWGVDGYDQQHPDILPPCEQAGGAGGMKRLADYCREHSILFALHDQYRDYYLDSRFYDGQNAIHDASGAVPGECTWNGGDQSYLCTVLAPYYVARNYDGLEELGILPDGAYLDVFSCVPPDECHHNEHRMSRRDCIEYRALCLELLRARGFIMSSETAVDTLIPHIELCHHAPYGNQYGNPAAGIPVPLLNLVYHDCVIIPWAICDRDKKEVDRIGFLQAILNGGPAYLDIEAGEDELMQVDLIAGLQKKVADKEMVRHEFLNPQRTVERVTYEGGISVTVDFDRLEYSVHEPDADGY